MWWQQLLEWAGTSDAEIIAALLSLAGVGLAIKALRVSWPINAAGTVLYGLIFLHEKFYSDALLQVVFLALQVYGFIKWAPEFNLSIRSMKRPQWINVLTFTPIAWVLWTWYLTSNLSDARMPWVDSLCVAISVAAVVLQAYKFLENWWFWIVADIIYVPMFFSAGKYVTAALYAIFIAIAIAGLLNWRRMKKQDSVLL
jgi:nicotinamide mononucleotide transporter PnuC